MSYLVDTHVLSEYRKGAKADRGIRSWFELTQDDALFISVLTLGELRRGAGLTRRSDPAAGRALDEWLARLVLLFGDRVVDVDRDVSDAWGRIAAARPVPAIDGLLAATALTRALTLVTRNTDAFDGLGLELLNPFED